ncbi:MAG: isoprenylcysteine carboxylmethyltransferase family protein [Terracidiphilus sp.]|jgi:protein-S-isoprenylcysteine O-methyltransferase Ste14
MDTVDRKTRWLAALGSAAFFFVAPGTVAGLVPLLIGKWRFHAPFFGFTALRALGILLMAAGLIILIETFLRFALKGLGTPAPILPTKHLVVTGSYRFVRNPMYVAVVSLILGQALFFGDMHIFIYAMCAWLVTHLFVLTYEEPTLRRTFPDEYSIFCTHVPRWIPRLTPWNANQD